MMPFAVTNVAALAVKLIALIGIAVYIIFAGVMVRQEHMMANVLEETFEPVLRILTLIHLVASVGLFILAIIIL